MTRTITYFMIIFLGSFPPSVYADKPTPGLYSITTRMESDMPIPTQTDGGEMTMNSEGTYSATGYTMTSNMQMTSGGIKAST